ncbi:hypothetical protein FB451DRAFT_1556889 [Mycena latifolia]|nr:hypothetical protein FB451DRAFT_1556889 [Mycena latifolia]
MARRRDTQGVPDAGSKLGVLRILERLASHESMVAAVLSLNVSTKLVSLFRLLGHLKLGYSTHTVLERVVLVLAKISEYPEDITSIVATDFRHTFAD